MIVSLIEVLVMRSIMFQRRPRAFSFSNQKQYIEHLAITSSRARLMTVAPSRSGFIPIERIHPALIPSRNQLHPRLAANRGHHTCNGCNVCIYNVPSRIYISVS